MINVGGGGYLSSFLFPHFEVLDVSLEGIGFKHRVGTGPVLLATEELRAHVGSRPRVLVELTKAIHSSNHIPNGWSVES